MTSCKRCLDIIPLSAARFRDFPDDALSDRWSGVLTTGVGTRLDPIADRPSAVQDQKMPIIATRLILPIPVPAPGRDRSVL